MVRRSSGASAVSQAEVGGGQAQGGVDVGDYLFTYDGNGNVAQVLDRTATTVNDALVAHYDYDPYGNVINDLSSYTYAETNRWRFSTHQYDPATGLIYAKGRYYDAVLGRWLNRDPIGEAGGVNLYAYVVNCPTMRVDSFGLDSISAAPLHLNCGKWRSKGPVTMSRKKKRVPGRVSVWNPDKQMPWQFFSKGCSEQVNVELYIDYQILVSTKVTLTIVGRSALSGEWEDAPLLSWYRTGFRWPDAEQAYAGSMDMEQRPRNLSGVLCRVLERCQRRCVPACDCCACPGDEKCVFSGDEGDARLGMSAQWRYGTLKRGALAEGGYYCELFPAGFWALSGPAAGVGVQPATLKCYESSVGDCNSGKRQDCGD